MKKQPISTLLSRVMFLANKANEETDKCVFVSLSGHVDILGVSVTPSKEDYITRIAETTVFRIHENADSLVKIINSLEHLIDVGEVKNYDLAK